MKKGAEGSSLLFVLMIMTILTLFVATVWRTTSYTYDLILQRGIYEKQFRLTESLLHYAIALCKKNYTVFVNQNVQHDDIVTLVVNPWPPAKADGLNQFEGKIQIKAYHTHLLIKVFLYKEKIIGNALRCELTKKGGAQSESENCFIISNWHLC